MTGEIRSPIARIHVRLRVGDSLLAASDDPLYLGLRGGSGREFRLHLAKGKSLRRGGDDHYVLGPAHEKASNVEHAELNDPTIPALDAEAVSGVYLRKGMEPIPNVRAMGEMDDRLEVLEAEVEFEIEGAAATIRYHRKGPIWLGLVSGLRLELPRVDAE